MPAREAVAAALFCGMAGAQSYVPPALAAPKVGLMVAFDQPPQKDFLKQLRREVEQIFRPSGLDLTWELRDGRKQPGTYDRVALLDFRGQCGSNRLSDARGSSTGSQRLGETVVSEGEVLPFTFVDCNQIASVVRNVHQQWARESLLPGIYRHLAARVVAHELMHALLRTADHHPTDCMRPSLQAPDLQSEARLTPPEIAALRLVGRAAPSPTLAQGARRAVLTP